jgi:hypothetical protein
MLTTKTCPIAVTALLVTFTVIITKAQSNTPQPAFDTLAYLRSNIAAKQKQTLHQPLSTLLKQVRFPVKKYLMLNWKLSDPDPLGMMLFFEEARPGYQHCYIKVSFDQDVSTNKVLELIAKSWGDWNQLVQAYYGRLTLKSIEVGKLQ